MNTFHLIFPLFQVELRDRPFQELALFSRNRYWVRVDGVSHFFCDCHARKEVPQ
jgi:hypothetical protein